MPCRGGKKGPRGRTWSIAWFQKKKAVRSQFRGEKIFRPRRRVKKVISTYRKRAKRRLLTEEGKKSIGSPNRQAGTLRIAKKKKDRSQRRKNKEEGGSDCSPPKEKTISAEVRKRKGTAERHSSRRKGDKGKKVSPSSGRGKEIKKT